MRLKVKLFNEWLSKAKISPAFTTIEKDTFRMIYIAGFEKAREMAYKLARDNGSDCGACWESDTVLNLGEEEATE